MRGIPGSGKSTLAKSLEGEGIIHSTDTIIEARGDYFAFFDKMRLENDFSSLGRMHKKNLSAAKASMHSGLSPVIIDNTNLKANEAKEYVKYALSLGYADENIIIEDVGTAGLTAEELVARNTHGVPLDKIKKMIDTYNSVGPLTIQKILESKDMENKSDVLYSAVVLDDFSKNFMMNKAAHLIPRGWKDCGTHMTIIFGKGLNDKAEVGREVELTATRFGISDKACALGVEGYPTANEIPHITLGVNTLAGGKPVDSNKIEWWVPIPEFKVSGIVTEIKKS